MNAGATGARLMNLRATVRLQFHRGFTFADAERLVPYFSQLGISHVYASPILTAQPGSTHGYDVVDPTQVNPELGGEAGLRGLVAALRSHEMGLILDIVPNHMGIGTANPWWADVLTHGNRSPYAGFFDIDWHSPDPALAGKVLLPVLGAPYGECLARGELRVVREDGTPAIGYYDKRFPLSPETRRDVAGDTALGTPRTREAQARLHAVLERQHYRLAWWRTANDELNWRRFFDVNELAGLRIEEPQVFDAVHGTTLRLYAGGLIDGLRIDHVDGLADPRGYCRKLFRRLSALTERRPQELRYEPFVVVEKILAADERLPADWSVAGTTGYDFMSDVAGFLHDPAGEAELTRLWVEATGRPGDFPAEEEAARAEIIGLNLAVEFEAAVLAIHRIARLDLATRDVSRGAIRRALRAIVVHFPAYRTYAGPAGRPASDMATAERAFAAAKAARHVDPTVVDLLEGWLGGEAPRRIPAGEARRARLEAIRRFQQLTAPTAAKAVEDTAFYRYGRLLSLNEVGSDPRRFGLTADALHRRNVDRRRTAADAFLATATHDQKRGEDARARLAVISENAERWARTVRDWLGHNAPFRADVGGRPAPCPADEIMLYETIVGAWPLDLSAGDNAGMATFRERLGAWQEKALREAKLHSSWADPNRAYEGACRGFLEAVMAAGSRFATEAEALVQALAPAGALNGLAQALIRLTAPGVPDLYQGTEYWDFSLVDPDNRKPVDFERRVRTLAPLGAPADLLASWRDGRMKQALIARVLAERSVAPMLFARGDYVPLYASGERSGHIFSFARTGDGRAAITIVPHLAARFAASDRPQVHPEAWGETLLPLPRALEGTPWRDVLTGASFEPTATIPVRAALSLWPVALLVAP